jgi:predicted AlkP superfamily phosphohydrolase/phosphomutase
MDKTHKDHVPGNPYEQQIRDYYKHIDTFIGEIKQLAPDNTVIYVVSDHGAKRMDGMFVINQWLADNGYLKFNTPPAPGTTIEKADVDWSQTRAWAWGGFYGRLFLNVKGREPQGVVEPDQVDAVLEEIRTKLSAERGPGGQELHHQIYRATELYPDATGDVPDLLIFWGDLYWKVAGTVGYPSLYIDQDDKGLDYGVHDWNGIFVKYDPTTTGDGHRDDLNILDVTPTILNDFGITPLPGMRGKII